MLLDRPGASLAEDLARVPGRLRTFLAGLSDREAAALSHDWRFWGRPGQQPPPGSWALWLLLTGRGWGKNRAMSEFAHFKAEQLPGSHGALVARTVPDVRDTVVMGISGVLATAKPWNPVRYVSSARRLEWRNGTTAHAYTSEEPDQLRGPNHHWGIGDEVATWLQTKAADGGTALDHLRLSTRLEQAGVPPQLALGSTPRRTAIVKDLVSAALSEGAQVLTRGHMYENRANLARGFVAEIERRYKGTRLERQEIRGELLADVEGALLQLEQIDRHRRAAPEALARVLVGVDPSGGSGEQGIVAAGLDPACACGNGAPLPHAYVLADRSLRGSPERWGRRVVETWREWRADQAIAERNYGGDMVASTVRVADRTVPVKVVTATRGKHVRAAPVLALYEQGRIHHAGVFEVLEDQLCAFTDTGWEGSGKSPDRGDAAIWALTELLVKERRRASAW